MNSWAYLVDDHALTLNTRRGILRLAWPMDHGVVTDWDDMERIWHHLFMRELQVVPGDHPVLMTECPLNPKKNRERAAELMFERFNVPAFFVSNQAVLCLYGSGRTTGVVLDIGDGVSYAVPIYEGFAISPAMTRVDMGGRDVTEYLRLLLRRGGHNFDTSSGIDTVRRIKEGVGEVSQQPLSDIRSVVPRCISQTPTQAPIPCCSSQPNSKP
jgi:centractin